MFWKDVSSCECEERVWRNAHRLQLIAEISLPSHAVWQKISNDTKHARTRYQVTKITLNFSTTKINIHIHISGFMGVFPGQT